MPVTFDATQRIIICQAGTTSLSVSDLYSRWKDWVLAGNSSHLEAMKAVGGDDIDVSAGTRIPAYVFLVNGWRIRPQEANHTLSVVGGVLLVDGGGDPFVNTLGAYRVAIRYSQPVQAITVSTGGGSPIDPATIADAVWETPLNATVADSAAERLDKIQKAANLAAALAAGS